MRIGTEVITDPAMLIGKNIEDHITWVDSSSIKKKIQNYKDQVDDYDLLNWLIIFFINLLYLYKTELKIFRVQYYMHIKIIKVCSMIIKKYFGYEYIYVLSNDNCLNKFIISLIII